MTKSDDMFKGYNLFNDVKNVNLQTWNRLSVFFNIMSDAGSEQAKAYISKFDEFAKQRIKNMLADVKVRGYSTVRREVLLENTRKTSTVH